MTETPQPTERELLLTCAGLTGLIDAASESLAQDSDPAGITRTELAQAKGAMCQELAETEQLLKELYGWPPYLPAKDCFGVVHIPGRAGD